NQAKAALRLLNDALAALPTKATPNRWSQSLADLGKALGLAPFATTQTDMLAGNDAAAWQSITTNLASLEQFDTSLGRSPRELSLSDLLTTLLDIATNEFVPRNRDESGRVRILSAPAARNVSCRHLFLCGMSEQSFPSPERDGQLASDAEYRCFASDARKKSA